tara:strand:- start:4432 stop:4947 length:516 start_codon:yes stop_codon:yes gene_type:complete
MSTLHKQHGAALIICLILLFAMSVLAVSSMEGVTLQQKMTSNLYDRSLGFQAAESALREAEALVTTSAGLTIPASGCTSGVCSKPDAALLERWKDPAFNGWQAATVALGDLHAHAPQYIVEYMGLAPSWLGCEREVPMAPTCMSRRYRVTAISEAQGRARVVVQSNVAMPQ